MNDVARVGFLPVINRPTKICQDNPITKYSLIGHILTNFIDNLRPLSGVDLSISDHLLCYYVLESDVGVEVNNVESRVQVRPLPENRVAE